MHLEDTKKPHHQIAHQSHLPADGFQGGGGHRSDSDLSYILNVIFKVNIRFRNICALIAIKPVVVLSGKLDFCRQCHLMEECTGMGCGCN